MTLTKTRPSSNPPRQAPRNREQKARDFADGVINKAEQTLQMLDEHYSDLNVVLLAGHNADSEQSTVNVSQEGLQNVLTTIESNQTASADDKSTASAAIKKFHGQIGEMGSIADVEGFDLGDKHYDMVGLCLDQVSGKSAMFPDPAHDKLHTVLHEIGHIIHFRYFNGRDDTPQQQEFFADAFAAHIMKRDYGIKNAFEIIANKRRADNDAEYPFHLFAEKAELISDQYGVTIDRFNEQLTRKILRHSAFKGEVDQYIKTANNADTPQAPQPSDQRPTFESLSGTSIVLSDGIYNAHATSDPKKLVLTPAMLFTKQR